MLLSEFKKHKARNNGQSGLITPLILIMASIFIIFGVSLMNWAMTGHKDTVRKVRKVQSLEVAEAGLSYYKWHLAHNSEDYKDGNNWCCNNNPALTLSDCGGSCGPYTHQYTDYNNNIIGEYSLWITPPEVGSTINTIRSEGYAYGNVSTKKSLVARIGKRSLAEYSFLSNASLIFSSTSEVWGPVHSNSAIVFNGTCHDKVTSSVSVTGSGGPSTLWSAPVPAIDFSLFTMDLQNIKTQAQSGGIYLPDSGGGKEGYLVRFNSNATVDIYKIDSLVGMVKYRDADTGQCKQEAEEIQNKTLYLDNQSLPSNGLIFIEDDVWVEADPLILDNDGVAGGVAGRITLAAARFPENPNQYTKIRFNSNIQYNARNGSYNLALISQGEILIPRYAPSNLVVDATILSQYKRGFFFRNYGGAWNCGSRVVKTRIENYGGILTYQGSGVKYGSPVVNGYVDSVYTYNDYLAFYPPPMFPTREIYEFISWTEE